MIVNIRDRATLLSISPTLVAGYLRTAGWKRAAHEPTRYSIWARESAGSRVELLLPLDASLGDFAERMAELLEELQRVEARSQLAILRDVETTSCDVFRFKEDPHTSFVGTIPLDEGARLVSYARDFLLYGATAEHSPQRASLAGKRSEEVASFMSRALLGQTEASSFIVRAQVPVPGRPADELFPEAVAPGSEPFERRAGVRMMTVLRDTREAAVEAIQTSNYGPFSELLQSGGSIGLYNTVAEAQDIAPASTLEITCSWAPSRPAVGKPPLTVVFEPELVLPIREAVRILLPTVPREGVHLVGLVELLQQGAQEELIGEVAMTTLVEGRARKVYFFLERPTYNLAIQAFDARVPLAVRGDLVKEGKHWRLKAPRDVRVVENPEASE